MDIQEFLDEGIESWQSYWSNLPGWLIWLNGFLWCLVFASVSVLLVVFVLVRSEQSKVQSFPPWFKELSVESSRWGAQEVDGP